MEFIGDLNWMNIILYLTTGWSIISLIVIYFLLKNIRLKNFRYEVMQQQNIAKIDGIRKEHLKSLEQLRNETIKKNDERNRQWAESEKETLHVLNGVSNILDLSEKIGRVEADKIISKLNEIQTKINSNNSEDILNKLEEIQIKLEVIMNSNDAQQK